MRYSGKVKWFNDAKGFGFITPDDSSAAGSCDLFAHYSGIDGSGFRSITEGERVTFEVRSSLKGLQAVRIRKESA